MRKPAIASDHVEERHGVSRPLGGVALLDLSDTGSATTAGTATALVLATFGYLASTRRAELGRGALAGVERTSAHCETPIDDVEMPALVGEGALRWRWMAGRVGRLLGFFSRWV